MRSGSIARRIISPLPFQPNTSGGGDSIVVTPNDLLDADTEYTFEVTDGVKDTSGARFAPFVMTFKTASGAATSDYPVAFDKIALPDTKVLIPHTNQPRPTRALRSARITSCTHRHLTAESSATRFIPMAGSASLRRSARSLPAIMAPRLITGIEFDPAATADNLILWVSHGQMTLQNATRLDREDQRFARAEARAVSGHRHWPAAGVSGSSEFPNGVRAGRRALFRSGLDDIGRRAGQKMGSSPRASAECRLFAA